MSPGELYVLTSYSKTNNALDWCFSLPNKPVLWFDISLIMNWCQLSYLLIMSWIINDILNNKFILTSWIINFIFQKPFWYKIDICFIHLQNFWYKKWHLCQSKRLALLSHNAKCAEVPSPSYILAILSNACHFVSELNCASDSHCCSDTGSQATECTCIALKLAFSVPLASQPETLEEILDYWVSRSQKRTKLCSSLLVLHTQSNVNIFLNQYCPIEWVGPACLAVFGVYHILYPKKFQMYKRLSSQQDNKLLEAKVCVLICPWGLWDQNKNLFNAHSWCALFNENMQGSCTVHCSVVEVHELYTTTISSLSWTVSDWKLLWIASLPVKVHVLYC